MWNLSENLLENPPYNDGIRTVITGRSLHITYWNPNPGGPEMTIQNSFADFSADCCKKYVRSCTK